MRTTAFAGASRRTAGRGTSRAARACTLSGIRRTRTLKDGLAALGKSGTRTRAAGCWTRRRGVHRARARLRDNEPTLRHDGLMRDVLGRGGNRRGRCDVAKLFAGLLYRCGRRNCGSFQSRRSFDGRRLNFISRRYFCHSVDLLGRFADGRNRCFLGSRRRDGRLGWHRHSGRRTRDTLWSNEPRRRFLRLHSSGWSGAGSRNRRLGDGTRRAMRHGRSWSHAGARRCHRCGGSRTRRCGWLGGLLRDRLPYIPGL